MRIVITGGAGFLGSHLCDRCLQEGHEVVAVDNCVTGSPANLAHIGSSQFRYLTQNISDGIAVDGDVDFILHFASPASPVDYADIPIETLRVGAMGTHNALELARVKGAGLLLASTSEVYGDPLVHPQNENYWGNVSSTGPRSCYDEAKRYAEASVMAYRRVHDIDTRIVRIFNTYGPRMRLNDGRIVPNFMKQAILGEPLTIYGDGSQTRSFCYVDDLIEGIYRLMLSDEHDPVNIGNPAEFTVLEVAQIIKRLAASDSPLEFHPLPGDDPRQRRPDISRAYECLQWEPRVPVEEGLRRTLEYFQEQLAAQKNGYATPVAMRNSNRQDGLQNDFTGPDGVSSNGVSSNGVSSNGVSSNGVSSNGVALRRQQISELGPWFHNLHLPDGTETAPDHFLGDFPSFKWRQIASCIPEDLSGWNALDIGCNAGFYSFELARRGACVVGIDIDDRYLKQARWAAREFNLQDQVEFRRMQVYDLAHSRTEFDLVLFMGVFYHLRYPLLGLDIVARKVKRRLIFQTLTMPGDEVFEDAGDREINDRDALREPGWPKMAFIEHRLAGDPTNWWAANHAGVEAMLRSAGLRVLDRPGHEIYLCEPGDRELAFAPEESRAATFALAR